MEDQGNGTLYEAVEAGYQAGLSGRDHWENPHCLESSQILATQAWYGGWLRGKQELERNKAEQAKSIDNAQ